MTRGRSRPRPGFSARLRPPTTSTQSARHARLRAKLGLTSAPPFRHMRAGRRSPSATLPASPAPRSIASSAAVPPRSVATHPCPSPSLPEVLIPAWSPEWLVEMLKIMVVLDPNEHFPSRPDLPILTPPTRRTAKHATAKRSRSSSFMNSTKKDPAATSAPVSPLPASTGASPAPSTQARSATAFEQRAAKKRRLRRSRRWAPTLVTVVEE